MERRIVASAQTERLFDLQKIYSLAGRPGSVDAYARGSRGAIDALLQRYAKQILETDPPPASATAEETSEWRARVREHASNLIGEIRRDDEPHRQQIARELAGLPEHDRIWGQGNSLQPAQLSKVRAR
jgi:hypothetical protein